ncbi:putative peptidoglycan-recognition protein [Trypoxylus dichotomus]
MCSLYALFIFSVFMSGYVSVSTQCPEVVSRQSWGARPFQRGSGSLATPATYVIVHHTRTPKCITRRNCEKMVRSLQNVHVNYNGRSDIGYNFLIGEDGNIYEGVGWNRAVTNIPLYDRDSLHIAVMGDYTSTLPNDKVLDAMKMLIQCAVSKGTIYANYQLLGHRQVESNDCPGWKLQQEIKKWPHWGFY